MDFPKLVSGSGGGLQICSETTLTPYGLDRINHLLFFTVLSFVVLWGWTDHIYLIQPFPPSD